MGENGTPEARSADTIGIIAGAVTGSDPAVTPDDPASASAALGATGPPTLRSEQLRRLADTAAATLALPTPAVDHEQQLPAEALARVLDAVAASTAAARKRAYRSDWGPVRRLGRRRGFPPLPAPPAVLAHYVTEAPPSRPASGVAVRPPPIWRPRSRTARTALRGSAPWEIRRRSTGRWRR